jgi:hypothetical protein
MRTKRTAVLIALLWSVLDVRTAGAVADVAVNVTDGVGAVEGARITLEPVDAGPGARTVEATTTSDGTARLTVPGGRYRMTVTTEDNVTATREVTAPDGTTTREEVRVAAGWKSQLPGGLGGITVGPVYRGQWIDLSLGDETERISVTSGGFTGMTMPGMTTPGGTSPGGTTATTTLDRPSRGRDVTLDLNMGGVEAALGLPTWKTPISASIIPALNVMAGAADMTIESTNPADRSTDFELDGTGPLLGAGIDLVVVPSARSPLFFGLGYQYSTLWADLDRSPCSPITAQTCSADVDLDYHQHTVSGRVGYSVWDHRISPYVGLRGVWTRLDVESTIDRTLAGGITVENRIDQELERDELQGLVGVDANLFGPVFGRAEAAFGGDGVDVLFKIMIGFGSLRR